MLARGDSSFRGAILAGIFGLARRDDVEFVRSAAAPFFAARLAASCLPALALPMGLYDREYTRDDGQPGFQLSAPQSATMQLLAITIAVYIAQIVFGGDDPRDKSAGVTKFLELTADWYRRPWEAYRLLTYGFSHNPNAIEHILANMLVLGLFGRTVEDHYGRGKFLRFYLAAIVAGGLVWSLAESLYAGPNTMVGASAATTGIFILFALNFPRREVQLFLVFPMPAWVAALIGVAMDMHGSIKWAGPVAFTAHLGGAAFAYAFYRFDWLRNLGAGSWGQFVRNRTRPKLKVLAPDEEEEESDDLGAKVDEILAKIKAQGQDSLTRSERKLLEQASRHYQQKRK